MRISVDRYNRERLRPIDTELLGQPRGNISGKTNTKACSLYWQRRECLRKRRFLARRSRQLTLSPDCPVSGHNG